MRNHSDATLPTAIAAMLLMTMTTFAGQTSSPSPPAWRDQHPGTAYLGPDVLWRPREWLVFHLLDEQGGGFQLDFTVRDMNIYLQGPRPAYLMIFGPNNEFLARTMVEDDGIVSGNERFRDGIYDPFQDLRYREYQRHHSPGGYPFGKERSPLLEKPETIAPRHVSMTVPATAGPGIYRVMVVASWDHWISLTPNRPMSAGVHPGPGPLYVHQNRFREAYLYAPQGTQDIGFALTEEVQPFGWSLAVQDEQGREAGRTTPRTIYSYLLLRQAKPDSVYRLNIAGQLPGCCLSVSGVPFVLCPDADTARKLHGGVTVHKSGRWLFHQHQQTALAWALSLKPEDLAVAGTPPPKPFTLNDHRLGATSDDLPAIIASQDLDPASPTYGDFKPSGNPDFEKKFNNWNTKANSLIQAFHQDVPDNGYRHNPVLVRRVALHSVMRHLLQQGPYWVFSHSEQPHSYREFQEHEFWGLPYRSGWYGMHDAMHPTNHFQRLGLEHLTAALPASLLEAWRLALNCWGYTRALTHAGECTNQWGVHLSEMAATAQIANDPYLTDLCHRGVERWGTIGVLGRVNPDPSPFCTKSASGFGYAADMGWVAAGFPADGQGFDAEYCNEGVMFIRGAYEFTRHSIVMDRHQDFLRLKAHLALPVGGRLEDQVTCPTDMSHRTPYPHARPPIYAENLELNQDYADTFQYPAKHATAVARKQELPPTPRLPLPCLEEGAFVRNFDNTFFFIKTPAYYAIAYGGETTPVWSSFAGAVRTKDGSTEFFGAGKECGYGARGRIPSKLAGISAIFVPECGPVLLSSNQDIFYVNQLWYRERQADRRLTSGAVIPEYDSAGYVTPWVQFDEDARVISSTAQFQYAPLLWTRTVQYRDEWIEVTVDVTATGDVNLANFCESLPYHLGGERQARPWSQDWHVGAALPALPPRSAPPRHREQGEATDEVPQDDLQAFAARALDISGPSGAGAAFVLPAETQLKLIPPMTYNVQAIALPLNPTMKQGERQTIRYLVVPHSSALTPERLRQVTSQAGW